MRALFAGALLLLGVLRASAQETPPYVPFFTTPEEVVERMLALAGTGPNDVVYDLGSGDGRIVLMAAQKFGARGVGIELDRERVAQAREAARRAGLAERVAFIHGDVLQEDLRAASVVTVYLLPGLLDRLQRRFLQLSPGTRVVSHAFRMAGWPPDRVETMSISRPHAGQGEESTLFLWVVPAEARGQWRGADTELTVHQNYQLIEVEGRIHGRKLQSPRATLRGTRIAWEEGELRFEGEVQGERITGELALGAKRTPLVLQRTR